MKIITSFWIIPITMNFKILVICQLITFVRTVSITRNENKKNQQPEFEIPGLGKIQGKLGVSYITKRPIYEFFGINYAKSPCGKRRFQVRNFFKILLLKEYLMIFLFPFSRLNRTNLGKVSTTRQKWGRDVRKWTWRIIHHRIQINWTSKTISKIVWWSMCLPHR